MCLRPFGLYCSACLGILFVSILCMCCSHFSWCGFISFTILSAPVFSLIHWFFLYLVLLFQEGVLKIFYINYIKLSSSTCFERHPLIFRRSMMLIVHVCSLWYSHSLQVASCWLFLYDLYYDARIHEHKNCRQPQTYVKPEAAITVFELLMMSGVARNMLSN